MDQMQKGTFMDEKLSRLMLMTYLRKSNCSWLVSEGFLHAFHASHRRGCFVISPGLQLSLLLGGRLPLHCCFLYRHQWFPRLLSSSYGGHIGMPCHCLFEGGLTSNSSCGYLLANLPFFLLAPFLLLMPVFPCLNHHILALGPASLSFFITLLFLPKFCLPTACIFLLSAILGPPWCLCPWIGPSGGNHWFFQGFLYICSWTSFHLSIFFYLTFLFTVFLLSLVSFLLLCLLSLLHHLQGFQPVFHHIKLWHHFKWIVTSCFGSLQFLSTLLMCHLAQWMLAWWVVHFSLIGVSTFPFSFLPPYKCKGKRLLVAIMVL